MWRVQRLYPQVYVACHTRHVRAKSSSARLSANDASLLAHLDEHTPTRPGELARHLGIGGPTLSPVLERLAGLGYLSRQRSATDRRHLELRLTPAGAKAIGQGSVLDAGQVKALLSRLTKREREVALEGLSLLARAARELGPPRRSRQQKEEVHR